MLLLVILSGFAASLLAPWVFRIARARTGLVLAVLPFFITAYFLSFIPGMNAGAVHRVSYPWVAALGLNLSFQVDGLAVIFALLIAGIGSLVLIYASGYLGDHHQGGRFYAYILMFMASMLGLVTADNLLALFVFWELTSISSYLLIGFNHESEAAREGAWQALLVTAGGGLALLAGLVMLGQVGGSFEISGLLAIDVRGHDLYLPILVLVLAGAFTKSAQFPFYFWLPAAMEAPTPVSAYLHSATMVKAGVYLLARLSPVLGGTEAWFYALSITGAVTMAIGAYLAIQQTDLKKILAYTTVSALGMMVLLLGVGTELAVGAALTFLLAHAFYKGALFLVAGAVDHETGTRDILKVRGLRLVMPVTSVFAIAAAISMAGLPPTFGFVGKELLYEALLVAPVWSVFLIPLTILSNVFYIAAAGLAGLLPFVGRQVVSPKKPHEAPLSMWAGPALLAALGLTAGISPRFIGSSLVTPGAAAVLGTPVAVDLALWHGITVALLLSTFTVACAIAVYGGRDVIRRTASEWNPLRNIGPSTWYYLAFDGVNALARWQTRVLQNGYLRYYIATIILATVTLAGFTLMNRSGFIWPVDWGEAHFYEVLVALITIVAALVAVRSNSRLAAVVGVGVAGYGTALIFLLFGAPDLAMTQILVDTLTIILLVLAFYRMPNFKRLSSTATRVRDIIVALSAGALVTALVLAVTWSRVLPSVSGYFAEASVPMAHGRNLVNVILVDFRALDTLGEITVLVLAGIGVYAILKLRPEGMRNED
jgi:multicomponent Na+:H+ antiporter subunit A